MTFSLLNIQLRPDLLFAIFHIMRILANISIFKDTKSLNFDLIEFISVSPKLEIEFKKLQKMGLLNSIQRLNIDPIAGIDRLQKMASFIS